MFNLGEPVAPASSVEMQEGFARLSRGAYFKEASLDITLSLLTESAGQITGIERVSIWALADGGRELRCLELYERSRGQHSSGVRLAASRYPAYFKALQAGDAIVADDAYLHPATAGFAADYLPRHNILAMLDTPIHIRGDLQGVLCFEQVGSRHPWSPVHRLFAHAVANLVTLALVEYEAGEAKRQAQHANERLRAVFDASRDAMVLADGESGLILDVNRQAERLFGGGRLDLIGRHQRQLHPLAEEERCAREFRKAVEGESVTPVRTLIRCLDGGSVPVEITAEVADVEGRRLALGIFRRLDGT